MGLFKNRKFNSEGGREKMKYDTGNQEGRIGYVEAMQAGCNDNESPTQPAAPHEENTRRDRYKNVRKKDMFLAYTDGNDDMYTEIPLVSAALSARMADEFDYFSVTVVDLDAKKVVSVQTIWNSKKIREIMNGSSSRAEAYKKILLTRDCCQGYSLEQLRVYGSRFLFNMQDPVSGVVYRCGIVCFMSKTCESK